MTTPRILLRPGIVAAALLILLAALVPPAQAEPTLDQALRGEAIGRGRFKSGLFGLDRGFTVRTIGSQSGDVFVLDQLFRFDDGQVDRRTWNFRRTGPNSYVGSRRDVIGLARVDVFRDVIRMSYDVNMRRRNGKTIRLHFEDTVSRIDGTTLVNRATIYTLGIPVGSVETTLTRRDTAHDRAPPSLTSARPRSTR